MANLFNVGDVLCYVFHYNCRIPVFVRVTKVSDKSVWLESLEKRWVEDDGYGQNGTVAPDFTKPSSPIDGCFRIKNCSYGPYVKIKGTVAMRWDGNPEDQYTD